jgi:low temperature requirement protein LtrA
MTDRAAALRRNPEGPLQVTFLELFFDLVFVFALFQLSHELLEHLEWSGAVRTAVLVVAVWTVWNRTSRICDRYDPSQPSIRVLIIGSMFGAFVMAVAIPKAFSTRGLMFAGTYIAVQMGRNLFLMILTRGSGRKPETRLLLWYVISGVPWLAGAIVQGWPRIVLWVLAAGADYEGFRLGWPTPGRGRASKEEVVVSGEFLAERQRQFFIIALGELILITGLAVTSSGLGAGHVAAAVVAFITAVLLWRIYIYRAGQVMGPAVIKASDPLRFSVTALYSHTVMVAGLVATSVGYQLVIAHPAGHIQPAWSAVIFAGPALFLAGRVMLEYVVFGRMSKECMTAIVVLAAVSPAMILAPPLLAALTAAVIVTGAAAADTARGRRHPGEPPSSRPGPAQAAAAAAPGRSRNEEPLVGSWIQASNLCRFLEIVSSYVGYRFDHRDWQAIQASLDTVTSDNNIFSYELTGQRALTLTLSKGLASDEVSVQIAGRQDRMLGARITGLADAFQ